MSEIGSDGSGLTAAPIYCGECGHTWDEHTPCGCDRGDFYGKIGCADCLMDCSCPRFVMSDVTLNEWFDGSIPMWLEVDDFGEPR